ncbi:MAG: 5'/3'-nucleotidase SurE [Bradymonadia bacterium]
MILVTNDDGIEARGIHALAQALTHIGDVMVVAPDRDRSGIGHAISLDTPLRARSRSPKGKEAARWAVDGTPTDCVYLGLYQLLPRKPDLVVSGINHGPNLADDVLYSGTVGGAMEGAHAGISSMAVSLAAHRPKDFAPAAEFAVAVAQMVLQRGLAPRTLLNVNVPDTDGAPVAQYRWTRAGIRDYGPTVTEATDPRHRPYYWIGADFLGFHGKPGSDCDAVEEGLATITPLTLDLTDEQQLKGFSAVDLPGFNRG